MREYNFPEKKKFAFTIFDDTDYATIGNVRPIYELLLELGIITTKSVWVFPTNDKQNPNFHAQTLSNPEYMHFIRWLIKNGFEIALHNASMSSSPREGTILAIERFNELLGFYPKIHVNHLLNRENIYWGEDRLEFPIFKLIMKIMRKTSKSYGHNPNSVYFWGDICQKYIKYVRSFVFKRINILQVNPTLPYHDPKRPYVNYWFSASDGGDVKKFNKLISLKNQYSLQLEGGVCIVYTHFANGFVDRGKVNQETKSLLIELSKQNGWFAPVSILLDYLLAQQKSVTRSVFERMKMEFIWFLSKIIHGTS